MSEKKIDVSQITSVNLATNLENILYGEYGQPGLPLLASIKDDSKEAIQTCSQELNQCSENLLASIQQADSYINSIANAFREMDEEIASKIEVQTTNGYHQNNDNPNKYLGIF